MSKVKALFLAAYPDSSPLKLDEEIRSITQKLREAEYRDIDLVSAWAVRPDDLLQMLNEHKPNIVHFSGHGSSSGEIILVDENLVKGKRVPKPVSPVAIKALFQALKDNVQVVLLNACFSRVQAEAIKDVIDCVIGMNTAIGDRAAITFAASFYRALGFGRSVKEAFEQGKVALLLEGIPEEKTPELLVKTGVDPSQIFLIKVDTELKQSLPYPVLSTYRPEPEKQLSKIVTFARQFSLEPVPSEKEAWAKLKSIGRNLFTLLGYAFLDTCEVTSSHDFTFLLSLAVFTAQDGYDKFRLSLACHITPFVSAFEELVSILFDKSDEEFLVRTSVYPEDLNIKFNYKWEDNILPYRIVRVGPKAIRVDCLDSNFVTVEFPLRTSDLLVVLSAIVSGKPIVYDDIDFSSLQQNEIEFMKYISTVYTTSGGIYTTPSLEENGVDFIKYVERTKKHELDLSDFSIDASAPESWNVTTKGIQQ